MHSMSYTHERKSTPYTPACAVLNKSTTHDAHGIRNLGMTWASFNGRSFFPSAFTKRRREDDEYREQQDADTNALDGFYPNVDRAGDPEILQNSQYSRDPQDPQDPQDPTDPLDTQNPRDPQNPRSPRDPQDFFDDDGRQEYGASRGYRGRGSTPRTPMVTEAERLARVSANFFYKGTLPMDENDLKKLFDENPMLADDVQTIKAMEAVKAMEAMQANTPVSKSFIDDVPNPTLRHGFPIGDTTGTGGMPSVALHGYVAKIPRAVLFNKDPSVPVDVDMVGPVLADFLTEVATAVRDRHDRDPKEVSTDQRYLHSFERRDVRDHGAIEKTKKFSDETIADTYETLGGDDDVMTKFSNLLRRMKRFDPWNTLSFTAAKTTGSTRTLNEQELRKQREDERTGIPRVDPDLFTMSRTRKTQSPYNWMIGLGREPETHQSQHFKTIDLSVSDEVFNTYKHNYQKMQVKTNLGLHHNQRSVTLVLESEADVWVACGGSATTLAPNTWLTRGSLFMSSMSSMSSTNEVASLSSLKDVACAFFKSRSFCENTIPPYIGNNDTFANQLYNLGYPRPRIQGLDDAFRVYKTKLGAVKPMLFDVVDVLVKGGYNDYDPAGKPNPAIPIRRAADLLVATSILCGLATPETALDDMIYRDLQSPVRVERAVYMVGASLDDVNIHKIANYFRHGKEAILKEFSDNMPVVPGGPDAKLITDPEYRRRFIALIRANNEIQKVNRNSVASDRRARMSEQEHIKRECLYFFKRENGTAAPIDNMFLL